MKSSFACYAIVLSIFVSFLAFTSVPALADDPPPSDPNGLNGTITLPSPSLALDDKSRISSGLTGLGGDPNWVVNLDQMIDEYIALRNNLPSPSHTEQSRLAKLRCDIADTAKDMMREMPPRKLLSISYDAIYGRGKPLHGANFILSDSVNSYDIGVQDDVSVPNSLGASFRYDPSRRVFARTLSVFYRIFAFLVDTANEITDGHGGLSPSLDQFRNALPTPRPIQWSNAHCLDVLQILETVLDRAQDNSLAVRYSTTVGYHEYQGLGSVLNYGVHVSVWLFGNNLGGEDIPTTHRNSQGLALHVSLQATQFNPSKEVLAAPSLNSIFLKPQSVRCGIALVWQDKVGYRYDDGIRDTNILRWKYQAGIEYLPHNALDRGRALGVFARCRIQPFTELTLSGGFDGNGFGYVGIGFAHSFDIGRLY